MKPQESVAYNSPTSAATEDNAEFWPMHRHDPARSGTTPAKVPASVAPLWTRELGGRLTACTTTGDLLCVADADHHRVSGLNAGNGQTRWSFTAGGPVHSPPTIHGGRVLFATADGWLYCLNRADGRLAWRRLIAPRDQRIVSYNQVESVWPLDGSVLAINGSLYAAAGRSSYLDGGPTGSSLWQTKTPIWCRAMVATARTLFIAGPSDEGGAESLLAATEGCRGGMLVALDVVSGNVIRTTDISSSPVYEGLIAAGEKLYLTTVDGKILCFGEGSQKTQKSPE
jgi:outer membrane protein assembly factor BamB